MEDKGCRNTWEAKVVETHEGEASRNTWEVKVVETHG